MQENSSQTRKKDNDFVETAFSNMESPENVNNPNTQHLPPNTPNMNHDAVRLIRVNKPFQTMK